MGKKNDNYSIGHTKYPWLLGVPTAVQGAVRHACSTIVLVLEDALNSRFKVFFVLLVDLTQNSARVGPVSCRPHITGIAIR